MKSKHFYRFVAVCLLFVMSLSVNANEDGEHADTAKHEHTTQQENTESSTSETSNQTKEYTVGDNETKLFVSFDKFPNLHPLFVHFPVVLLTLAIFSHIISLFIFNDSLGWVTLLLLIGGFVGGLLAAEVFHPHPGDLPAHVQKVFLVHESYADWTLWLSGIALVIKGISIAVKQKTWLEIIVLLVVLASGTMVSLTGHLGSQMVFIEDVGPQGKYLEQEHEHEH